MADVQPLRALHYDTAVAGPLADVVAPPYDVIDAGQRAALLERSPLNIVAVDLPQSDGRPVCGGGAPSMAPGASAARWSATRSLRSGRTRRTTPARTGARARRRGFFCRVRIEDYGPGRVRPHERTHPGPKEDRLRLTRATRANISPIFSLYSDPAQAAWAALEPATAAAPWGEVTDGDGTVHRIWRVSDPAAIAAVQAATSESELLIADGHHRYETMQAYAEEIGGEGEHRYILMCLVALEDPGLTVFPTHRLIRGLDEAAPHRAARGARARLRDQRGAPRGDRAGTRRRTAGARLHRLLARSARCGCGCATRRSRTRRCPATRRPTANSTRGCSRRSS